MVDRTRYVGRINVVKRLAPLQGSPGRTDYANGSVRIETAAGTIVARPPFPLRHEEAYDAVEVTPLLEAIGEDHRVGAILVRLGGYAVGVFDGERLVSSKVGQRYVHGRHRAGGSSANRFRRRREEQAHALLVEAGEAATRVLEPHRVSLDAVALGGDRDAVRRLLEVHPQLAWVEELRLVRFHAVPDPRQPVLERLPYEIYAVELTEIDDGRAVG